MRKDDKWRVLGANSVKDFSATGFFFSKEIYKKHKIPVGVIVSAVGGSVIRSWISYPEIRWADFPVSLLSFVSNVQAARLVSLRLSRRRSA
jgi:sialate O-acetylesterase